MLDILQYAKKGDGEKIIHFISNRADFKEMGLELLNATMVVAAKRGLVGVVKRLLAIEGISSDYLFNDAETKCTALITVCTHPDRDRAEIVEIARLLLKRGDLQQVNEEGQPLMHLALRSNQNEILKLLIKNLADLLLRNREEETILCFSAKYGSLEQFRLLHQYSIDYGYDVDLYYLNCLASSYGNQDVKMYIKPHIDDKENVNFGRLCFLSAIGCILCAMCLSDENEVQIPLWGIGIINMLYAMHALWSA